MIAIRPARIASLLGTIALALVPPPATCADYLRLPASGYLCDKPISTTVDSPLAKYYLEKSLPRTAANSEIRANGPIGRHVRQSPAVAARADRGGSFPPVNPIAGKFGVVRSGNEPFDKRIADIEQRFRARPLDWLTLREISAETSPDFATLYFIKQSLSDDLNAKFQESYWKEATRIISATRHNNWAGVARDRLRRYKLLFIPGFHYLSDQSSGADFYNQRQLFGQLGLHVELAATQEDGTIEENAAIVADIVRAESKLDTPLILVSASKGGPETALALGKILEPGETTSVKAWLSVGGLIQGTFLADRVMGWPKSWVAKIALLYSGIDPRSLPGMTTKASRARMTEIRLPPHIFVLQFVGAPLSGDIANDVRDRYIELRKRGPNDGLTLLADELLPNGITVIGPRLDHFYRDPEIDLKSLALANVVADELGR